jgi:methylenetetrahydrofolate dehydrogenase (NADP+)/methenyltetrahydrofolate cyclohydrolase
MQLLSSKELVVQIKERQARELKTLLQKRTVQPKLAIVVTVDKPAINVYMRMKQKYGADLGIDVDVHRTKQQDVPGLLATLNADPHIHGIIVQLPLEDPTETEAVVQHVAPQKDVDALGSAEFFEPATPMAILWLLKGHHIDLRDKRVVLVGRGKLVGAPLERMLKRDGVNVTVANRSTADLKAEILKADVVITATGKPGLIRADMLKHGAVVVDAGVAGEKGKTVGDVDPGVYERDDLTLTPTKGGVGPLTVCALFENVIRAASRYDPNA